MSSMKLFKPSYSYETNQRNFSKYEHQEHMSQSNYAKYECGNKLNSSSYDSKGQDYISGQAMGGFDSNESSHVRGNKSTNYYAHAQSAVPSPSIHVQEVHNKMDKMKMHESYVGQEWATNSPKCPTPTMVDQSMLTLDNEKHMMGEMEQGWANKPNQISSPAQYHQRQSMYKEGEQKAYNYGDRGFESGFAGKTTPFSSPKYLSPINTKQVGHMAHKDEHMMGNMESGWANSSSQFSSPNRAQQRSGFALHDEDHVIGKAEFGWANSPTKFPSSNQSHQLGHTVHKKEHMMDQNDHGWSNSSRKFSRPTQTQHSGVAMHNEEHMIGGLDHDWSSSPKKFSSPNQTHQSGLAMHKQEQVRGNMDRSWSNNKLCSPTQNHHSGLAMHKQEQVMGSMDRGLISSPNNFSSSTQNYHSSHAMHKDEHMMGKINHGWANSPTKHSGPNHFNGSNSTIYGERKQHDWAGKSNNGYGSNQAHYSAHASYEDYDQHVDEDVHDIMDEILTKYPSHNVSGGPGGHGSSWAAKSNNYGSQNQAVGFANQQAYGGPAHYGTGAQSMASSSSKFAASNGMKAGYSSNCTKEDYSSSSSTKKFQSQSMISRRV